MFHADKIKTPLLVAQGAKANLNIPPFDLTKIRARPQELLEILNRGIPGSGMPNFKIYTKNELTGLIGYMQKNMGIKPGLEPIPVKTSAGQKQKAKLLFSEHCVFCHGEDGRGTQAGLALRPPVPDMSRLALEPRISFDIITGGYPKKKQRGQN